MSMKMSVTKVKSFRTLSKAFFSYSNLPYRCSKKPQLDKFGISSFSSTKTFRNVSTLHHNQLVEKSNANSVIHTANSISKGNSNLFQ